MSNFVEKPILLVTDKFELNKDGVDFIKSLSDKKISIISVIGPKSSGKSFLSNQLVGIFTNGFNIGSIQNAAECCTKGIWVWGKPIINNDTYILILDSEGFQSEKEEQMIYNQKIFILLNLISSVVIYNYKKDDESDENNNISEQVIKNSYDLFFKLLPILDNVKLDNNNNKLTNENISKFIWLFRDYTVSDFNKYNDIINSIVQGNENYNTLFKNKINYSSLPLPMEENDMLINLYLDEEDDGKGGPFDDEYKKKINEFKKSIFGSSEPRILAGNPMTNSLLEALLNDYVKSLSLNETIYVNGPLNKLINEQLDKIKNNVIENLRNNLNEKNNNINDLSIKIKNSFDVLSNKAFVLYRESKVANNYVIENINIIIDLFGKELIEKYINNNITEYNDLIKNLISQKEASSPLSSNKISKKEDIKSFYNTFNEETRKDLDNNIFNSKYEFINSFPLIKNYFEKCIFNHINTYIDNIDNFFDITIKEQQASEELTKIVEQKNNEINNQKTQIEKMVAEINDLKSNIESKEKEYTNTLQTKKEEYEKLEQDKKSITEEKDNLIKELQKKNNTLESEKKELIEKNENLQKNLDEYTNKNKELEQKVNEFIEKEKRKPKPQMVNIKEEDLPKLVELFNEIQSATKEYNETIKLFTNNKSKIFFHNKFIEDSKNSMNDNCSGWVQELQKMAKERLESKDNIYIQEINSLKEEKNKINEELNKAKEEVEKIKHDKNNLAEELKLANDIKNDIESYKKDCETEKKLLENSNKIYKEKDEENEKKIQKMEFDLSIFKAESKMKDDEILLTLNAFKSLLEKNKKNFDNLLKKLSPNIQEELTSIGKRHKLIK